MAAAVAGLGLVGAPRRAFASTTCTGTMNGGTIHGGLVVNSSTTSCVLNGVTVDGGVTVSDGGRLFIDGSTIDGGVNVTAARIAQIGGSGDDPNDNLNGIVGPIPCGAGQKVNGGVQISGVTNRAELDSATVNGVVDISNNPLPP